MEHSDGDDECIERVIDPARDRLEDLDRRSRRQDRVFSEIRGTSVCFLTMDLYRKAVAARHPLAGFKVYGSGRHRRPDMHSEDRIY